MKEELYNKYKYSTVFFFFFSRCRNNIPILYKYSIKKNIIKFAVYKKILENEV